MIVVDASPEVARHERLQVRKVCAGDDQDGLRGGVRMLGPLEREDERVHLLVGGVTPYRDRSVVLLRPILAD